MGIFKDCDIRGVYGADLTEAEMGRIGGALAQLLQGRSIAVGGDFRTHTPQLKRALIEALLRGGAEVWDVGQLSTPQLYFSKRALGTWACAQVTASHNPPQYNGLKLMLGELPVLPEDVREVGRLAEAGAFPRGEGVLHEADTAPRYEAMLRAVHPAPLRPLKLVVDAGNGAMSETAPRVLAAMGLAVVPLFCQYDGRFPNRGPNPADKKNLTALCRAVVREGADFGAAFDGDGDRVIFVDGAGVPLMAEEAMVIFTRRLLAPGESVVYDLKCSSILRAAILEAGGVPIMERSGHAFIRRHFMQAGSRLAGEVSGHHFFRELGGDDGLFALVTMASILSDTGKDLRQLLGGVRYTAITPDIRVQAGPEEIDRVFAAMELWAREERLEPVRLDGVRLEFADGGWLLVRRSITEPAFTLRMEAPDEPSLAALRGRAARRLGLPQLAAV
jgi:phosphomannomutase/phosphoglucomutase